MCVVSDATPLRYLVLIDAIHLLPALFGRVLLPDAVVQELTSPQTPALVRTWMATSPTWLEKQPSQPFGTLPFPKLGRGEREAIALARDGADSLLLTDDFQARIAAESVGIQVMPTLRILSTAATLRLVDFKSAVARLQATNFRVSPKLIDEVGKQVP